MAGQPIISQCIVSSPDEMSRLGSQLAGILAAGDCIGLAGPLGAGKSTLARAMITTALAAHGIDAGDVPSPTFTLVQPYPFPATDDPGREIWHLDLWRLEDPEDVIELGLEEALGRHVSLIEWPERMGALLPQQHLMITITPGENTEQRQLSFHGGRDWADRLAGLDI